MILKDILNQKIIEVIDHPQVSDLNYLVLENGVCLSITNATQYSAQDVSHEISKAIQGYESVAKIYLNSKRTSRRLMNMQKEEEIQDELGDEQPELEQHGDEDIEPAEAASGMDPEEQQLGD